MHRATLIGLVVAGLTSVSASAHFKALQFADLDPGPLGSTLVEGVQIQAVDADQQVEVVDGGLLPGAAGNYGLNNLPRQALRVPSGGLAIRFAEPAYRISLDVVNLSSLEGSYLSLFNGNRPVGVIQLVDLLDPESDLYDPYLQLGENSLNRIEYMMTGSESDTPWFDRAVIVLPEGTSIGGVQMVYIGGSGAGGTGFPLTHIDEQSGGDTPFAPLPPVQSRSYGGPSGGGAVRNNDPDPIPYNPLFAGPQPLFPSDDGGPFFGDPPQFPDFDPDLVLPGSDEDPSTPDTPVPEPASAIVLAAVLGGVLSMRRRLG